MVHSNLKLSPEVLTKLPGDVKVPQYNRNEVKAGIFHFGVGSFHRAHQALIMDKLFTSGVGLDWGICGVGVLPQDQRMKDVMTEQKCLYTLVEKESSGEFSYRVIGAICEYLFAPDNVDVVIERLASAEARIVSLTITEGGYNYHPDTHEFDVNEKLVSEDIKNPRTPKTVFGIVIEALRRRKERNMKGFTIMSCDNLQENGKIARKAFLGYANAVDADLANWMTKNVTFPSSMVDRITPVTTDDDRAKTSEKLGLVDGWPVVCEPFIQWVLEDSFVNGRPPFEKSLVQLVDDVEPYEFMKLRLINAGHQAITYFGLLMDYELVHLTTLDERISKFLKAYMDCEATSTLKPLPGIDVEAYIAKTLERFQNPNVRDTLLRLAFDASERVPKFAIPVAIDRLAKGQSVWFTTAIVASFACYFDGVSESGKEIKIVDCKKEQLVALSKRLQKDPTSIQNEVDIFGSVVKNKVFIETFAEIYKKIRSDGSKQTLDWLLAKQ